MSFFKSLSDITNSLFCFFNSHLINIILSLLTGFVSGALTGALTSYLVTRYFREKDEKIAIRQRAKDLLNDCQQLLLLVDKFILELALRKYRFNDVIESMKHSEEENRRQIKNKEILKVELKEVHLDTLEYLLSSIVSKKLDKENKKKYIEKLPNLIVAMDNIIYSAGDLLLILEAYPSFDKYFNNIETYYHPSENLENEFSKYLEKIERSEFEEYQDISIKRDNFRKSLFDLTNCLAYHF